MGIAADETDRLKDKCYPLVEWGMTEKDCLAYCYAKRVRLGRPVSHFQPCFLLVLSVAGGLMNYENSIGIFLIYGNVLKNGTRTLGDHFAKIIPSVSLLYVLILRKSGRQQGGNIRSRAFYSALRDELARLGLEVKLCPT